MVRHNQGMILNLVMVNSTKNRKMVLMKIKTALQLYFLVCFTVLLDACKSKDVAPPTINVSNNTIEMGAITSNSNSTFDITQSGDGTISYTIISDKNWVKLSKSSGTISNGKEVVSINTLISSTDLLEGENIATLTITPVINGTPSSNITVKIKGIYKVTTLVASVPELDFGTIKTDKSMYVKFSKVGSENLTYDAVSDKPWLLLDKASASLSTVDSLKLTVNTLTTPSGNQTATITLTPKVNGVVGKPIQVNIKVYYDDTKSGNIEGHQLTRNETWAGNVYLTGSIVIPEGLTLTIKPGSIITVRTVSPWISITTSGGKLIMNGDESNIIVIKGESYKLDYSTWRGITVDRDIEMSYCYVEGANTGLNMTYHIQPKIVDIHHILFDNCKFACINVNTYPFSTPLSLKNLTFRNSYNYSFVYQDNSNINIYECEFNHPGTNLITLSFDSKILIDKSNFFEKTNDYYPHIVAHQLYAKKNKVSAQNCYGIKYISGFGLNGNVFTNTSVATSANINAGCGFADKFKNSTSYKKLSKTTSR